MRLGRLPPPPGGMGEATPRRQVSFAGDGDAAAGVDIWLTPSRQEDGSSRDRRPSVEGGVLGMSAEAEELKAESPRALGRGSALARNSAARLWGRRSHSDDASADEEAGPGSGRTFFVRNVAQREIEVAEREWKCLLMRQANRQRRLANRQGISPRESCDHTQGGITSPSNLWESMKDWSWSVKNAQSPPPEPSSQSGPPCSPLAGGTPTEVLMGSDEEDAEGRVPPVPTVTKVPSTSRPATVRSILSAPARQDAEFLYVRQWPIIDVLSPYSWQYVVWQYFMMALDFSYTAFFVPYAVVFFLQDCEWNSASAMVDFFAGWLYVFDVIINLRVGYSVVHKFSRRLELSSCRSALFYMRHGTFIVDLPATIPVFVQISCLCQPEAETSFALNVLQFIRLLRLLRLYRPFRLMASDALDVAAANLKLPQEVVNWMPLLQITILYAFIAHLMACIWWFTAVLEDASWMKENPSFDRVSDDGSLQLWSCREGILPCGETEEACISWADQAGVLCESDSAKYALAFYFATMTITTVGYGTGSGTTTAEYGVASVLMFIGTLFFGYIVSTTTLLLEKVSTKRLELQEYHDKIGVVKSWGRNRNLPRKLMKRVHNFYAMVWTRREGMEEEENIWEELPFPLKASAAIAITSPLMSKVTAMSLLSDDAWKHIAGRLQPVWKPPGEFLAHPAGQGDGVNLTVELDSFYLLEKGSIACLRKGSQVFRLEGPQVFGLSRVLAAVIPDIKSEAENVGFMSVTPCWLWSVPIEYVINYLEEHPSQMAAICEGVTADKTQLNLLGLSEQDEKRLQDGAEDLRAKSFLRGKKMWTRNQRTGTFGSRQQLRAVFEDEVAANTGNKDIPKIA